LTVALRSKRTWVPIRNDTPVFWVGD